MPQGGAAHHRLDSLAPANHQSPAPHTPIDKPIGQSDSLIGPILWLRLPSKVTLGYVKLMGKANGDRRKGTNFTPNLYAFAFRAHWFFFFLVVLCCQKPGCDTVTLFGNLGPDSGLIKAHSQVPKVFINLFLFPPMTLLFLFFDIY